MTARAPTPGLSDCLAALYERFARHRPRGPIEISPLKQRSSIAQLDKKPLRELTAEDLGVYAFSAVWTMGSESDFLHFFPRIAELLRDGLVGASSFALLAAKLDVAAVDPVDRALVQRFYGELFLDRLLDEEAGHSALDVLEGAAELLDDVEPLLRAFVPPTSRANALFLVDACMALRHGGGAARALAPCLAQQATVYALGAAREVLVGHDGAGKIDDAEEAVLAAIAALREGRPVGEEPDVAPDPRRQRAWSVGSPTPRGICSPGRRGRTRRR